jgi:hypothetical protein
VFERLVLPLHRLIRTVLPQMIERRKGKIVVVGSAGIARHADASESRSRRHRQVERPCGLAESGRSGIYPG